MSETSYVVGEVTAFRQASSMGIGHLDVLAVAIVIPVIFGPGFNPPNLQCRWKNMQRG